MTLTPNGLKPHLVDTFAGVYNSVAVLARRLDSMKQALDAIFENGIFRPLRRDLLNIADGQRVRITVDDEVPEALRTLGRVYDGLSPQDVDEIEQIALNRGGFFGGRSDS